MKKYIGLSLILLVVLVISGCGSKYVAEKAVENQLENAFGDNLNVDVDGDYVTIEGEDGLSIQTGEDVKLPEDFPKDVYVPEGNIMSVMKNIMGEGYSITLQTDEDMEVIYEDYKKELADEDWDETFTSNMGEIMMYSATKDERSLSLSISKEDGKTMVVLNLVQMPE